MDPCVYTIILQYLQGLWSLASLDVVNTLTLEALRYYLLIVLVDYRYGSHFKLYFTISSRLKIAMVSI